MGVIEGSPEVDSRIENVVVVAKDKVGVVGHVQLEFVGADLVLLGIVLDGREAELIFVFEEVENGCIDPVEVSLGIGAIFGIAGDDVVEADLLLGGDSDALEGEAILGKQVDGPLWLPLGGGLSSEVVDLVDAKILDGGDGRDDGGHGLPDAGGGFDEEFGFLFYGLVNANGHLPLPFTVIGIGKAEVGNGFVPLLPPIDDEARKDEVATEEVEIEGFEFVAAEGLLELLGDDFFVEVDVSKLDVDGFPVHIQAIEVSVALGLSPVERVVVGLDVFQRPSGGLDLVDDDEVARFVEAIGTTLHDELDIFEDGLVAKDDFFSVALPVSLLDFLVGSDAFQHPLVGPVAVVNVA